MSLDLATKFHFHDGKMTVERRQDCDPIAELCKAQQASGNVGSKDMKLAARIPYVVVEAYCNIHNLEFSEVMQDPVHMRRIVNDPDNAAFRVWRGRI